MFRHLTLRILLAFVITLLLATSCASAPAATVADAAIKIDPPASTVQVNDTLKVAVKAENVNNLIAFEAHLAFDPNILEVVELTGDGFVKADFSVQNTFDNAAGTIDYAVAQINRDPAAGSGTLFEIVFRAKAAGAAQIKFRPTDAVPTGMLLSDPNGMAIQVSLLDGSVSGK